MPDDTDPNAALVISALEHPHYTWRTVGGIATATGLTPRQVREILNHDPRVIKSEVPSADDEDLYSTFAQYRRRTPLWRRVWAAVRG